MTTQDKQHSLHDSLFKQIFKQKKYLTALLRVIFPPKVLKYLNLEQVKVRDGELIKRGGRQLQADLVATLGLKDSSTNIELTIIFEHKSYRDPDALIQVMEYFIELTRKQDCKLKVKRLVLPIVLLCCKDREYNPPSDYLGWVFGDKKIPKAAKILAPWLPKLFGRVVNIRKLVAGKEWTEPSSIAMILYGMSVWDADENTIAHLLAKAHDLDRAEASYLATTLNDYYIHADNFVEESDFERVERERWPDLKEEDRIMQTYYFGPERYRREGIAQGIEQGIEQGFEQGKLEMVKSLLLAGADEQIICKAAKLSKKELAKIKRSLDKG